MMLPRSFFSQELLVCARALVGQELRWHGCSGTVVETEAYAAENDEASHAFSRPSTRRFIAEEEPGTAYVYLNYGVHWMLNVLVKGGGHDGVILIRALEPRAGIPLMEERRGVTTLRELCSGPGKLGRALGITRADHGRDLCADPDAGFLKGEALEVVADVRVGISRAANLPWRFVAANSPWVSVAAGRVRPFTPAKRRIQPAAEQQTKRRQR